MFQAHCRPVLRRLSNHRKLQTSLSWIHLLKDHQLAVRQFLLQVFLRFANCFLLVFYKLRTILTMSWRRTWSLNCRSFGTFWLFQIGMLVEHRLLDWLNGQLRVPILALNHLAEHFIIERTHFIGLHSIMLSFYALRQEHRPECVAIRCSRRRFLFEADEMQRRERVAELGW